MKSDKFLLLAPLVLHFSTFFLLSFQFPFLFFLVSFLENLKFLICFFNQLIKLVYLLIMLILAFLSFCCEFLGSLFYINILPVQVFLKFLMNQRFNFYCGAYVLDFNWESFFRLFVNSSLVGQLGFGLFFEVGDLDFRLLWLVHEAFFELLDSCHILSDLFLVLFWLSHFFVL
jgi:hypothetical protein